MNLKSCRKFKVETFFEKDLRILDGMQHSLRQHDL